MSAAAIVNNNMTPPLRDESTTALFAPIAGENVASFKAKVLWALGAIALFFLLYGGCLWITSLRSNVGSFYFAWERYIPFVPWMIVPYMSIDLFFAGSFFVCREKKELNALGRRIMLATVIAAA